MPRVFANSILSRNAQEAIDKINASEKIQEKQKEKAVRIIKKLFSSKSRKHSSDESAESRIDYISDHLGLVKEEVINIVNLLREEKILADAKDLIAFIKKSDQKSRSLQIFESYRKIEAFLLPLFGREEKTYHLKELNEAAGLNGCEEATPTRIKNILNFWAIRNWIRRGNLEFSKNHFKALCLHSEESLKEKLKKKHELARFIVSFLYEKSEKETPEEGKEGVLVEFSVHELKSVYENSNDMFKLNIGIEDIEEALFYLSRIEAIKIEGGFLVLYNRLTIERTELDNRKQYKKEDYSKLNEFYENKVQQIHIVGEYAKKMIEDYRDALQFVEDYFQLNYGSFLNKYFPGSKGKELKLKMTPSRFRQLFGELSPAQLKIINDNEPKYIVVAAGPGSGKTRVLVHKLASLLLMEDVKHEQLLMITFSRAAASEFKKRLLALIGNAANFIEIKTFHSYCFDLLGKVGNIATSADVLKHAVEKIRNKEVETGRITKTVLVIDEAQDMNEDEFSLVKELMIQNEEMRVIAVGDDDQNIYEFRGADSRYLEEFMQSADASRHELNENYRSKANLVEYTNQVVTGIRHRLKDRPIVAHQPDDGRVLVNHYQSSHLIYPLVSDILAADLAGTTCVLTRTNEEALQVTGLLLKNGLQAKLIQTNDTFNLYNLLEVRGFIQLLALSGEVFLISDEQWSSAKKEWKQRFANSSRFEACDHLIASFEAAHPTKKYKSDFEAFIRESKLEDFYEAKGETILVSTMHRAKGKEFDNVFLLLENYDASNDASKRLLYMAMTRARNNLRIHLNVPFLDEISVRNMIRLDHKEMYSRPKELVVHLSLKDIWLDYSANRQPAIAQCMSGDDLQVNGNECLIGKGLSVLKFSKGFIQKKDEWEKRNYVLKFAKVNFIIFWLKEEGSEEAKIILPELYFERLEL